MSQSAGRRIRGGGGGVGLNKEYMRTGGQGVSRTKSYDTGEQVVEEAGGRLTG